MRSAFLDDLRGVAVVWMVLFHTCYDMNQLGFVQWNFSTGFWYAFPRVIAFTFLFCVGMSLNFVHAPAVNWKSLGRRSLKLAAGALLISLSTYLTFPHLWVFFGTLHCILAGSLLGAPLVNHRKTAAALLVAILLGQYGLGFDIDWVASLIQKPSLDFIPIYPWFWAVLAGVLAGPYLLRIKALNQTPPIPSLTWAGKHSLKIYLLHQPLIYGVLLGVKSLP